MKIGARLWQLQKGTEDEKIIQKTASRCLVCRSLTSYVARHAHIIAIFTAVGNGSRSPGDGCPNEQPHLGRPNAPVPPGLRRHFLRGPHVAALPRLVEIADCASVSVARIRSHHNPRVSRGMSRSKLTPDAHTSGDHKDKRTNAIGAEPFPTFHKNVLDRTAPKAML